MTIPTIAVIGAGNMGKSLIGGLINHGYPPNQIWASDSNHHHLEQIKNQFAIHITMHNQEAVQAANTVIFAIKPQILPAICQELASCIKQHKPLVISIAAGIRQKQLAHWLGKEISIVRAMPNMPALIGCGATAGFANDQVTANERQVAENILQAIGVMVWVKEEAWLDTITALSGSGPAYFFLIMESLADAANKLGIPADMARLLTCQTALGAAKMALATEQTLDQLREQVTSPGGTTEQGLAILNQHHIQNILQETLLAAKKRAEELSNKQ